ncbi:MAG: hypothetical protein H7Z71_03875 [Moraxellaceae bacterium]|nr:hypothetical protein [Pseudobdellovibrionaceae bacterium]
MSTLRRKIKSTEIEFRFDDGRYMILDSAPPSTATLGEQHRPSLKSDVFHETAKETGESVITAANRLLADLKKAYTQVLHDKEAQISDLREEISDLKTLIKVLESENDRLRGH